MYLIGLTGGIASGKSTVSSTMKDKYNIPVIDGDKIAYDLSLPEGEIWKQYVGRYGKERVLLENETLNRAAVASIVFSSPKEKKWMDDMAFPIIWNKIEEKKNNYEKNGEKIVVLDIPLLIESGWYKSVDSVWVVYVNPDVQLERLIKRNNLTKENAKKRITSQMSLEEKRTYADVIIDNSGQLDDTLLQLDAVFQKVLCKV